jgi:glycosyltransferase involved in cell wall biosynthesis
MAWNKKFLIVALQGNKTKVLVVCMLDSVHTYRWLDQFKDANIEFHLFPSTPNRQIHNGILELSNSRIQNQSSYQIHYGKKFLSILLWAKDLILKNKLRGFLLNRLINKLKIDIVHSMELNHAGYISAEAFRSGKNQNFRKIATVWGSDIFWFRQFPKHKEKLKEILRQTDLLISECVRDQVLAEQLEFRGQFLNSPSLFGYPQKEIEDKLIPPSERKIILVKGYESFVGRASLALEALIKQKKLLGGFEIHVYSTTWKTRRLIKKLNRTENLRIKFYPKKSLTSVQMLDLFKLSRIHLGVSLSDGVPASLLESIVTGAFPIQTNTACADQWVTDGKTGLVVNPDIDQISDAIKTALTDDLLVDQAMQLNKEVALSRLINTEVSKSISHIYS